MYKRNAFLLAALVFAACSSIPVEEKDAADRSHAAPAEGTPVGAVIQAMGAT